MRYEIVLAPEALEDVRRVKTYLRSQVRDAMEECLRHEPTRTRTTRIKRLRGVSRPQFRLRVGDIRVFYDVTATTVDVLAILPKAEAAEWLRRWEGVS